MRPARGIRSRQDENALPSAKSAIISQKAAGTATALKAAVAVAKENASGTAAMKAEPRRRAFGDVSNAAKPATRGVKTEKGQKVILKEKDQIAVKAALVRPLQRSGLRSGSTTTGSGSSTFAKTNIPGPARRIVKIVRKSEIYTDRRPSPQKPAQTARGKPSPRVTKPSPRSKTGSIIRREVSKVAPTIPGRTVQALKQGSRNDIPHHSDQLHLSHLRDDNINVEDDEDTDDDATDVEDEDFQHTLESISDVDADSDEDEGDDELYVSACSRVAGDNTTAVTAPILLPKFSLHDRKVLKEAERLHGGIDDDDVYDISMVAEYGDEIFEYMRNLEVSLAVRPIVHRTPF